MSIVLEEDSYYFPPRPVRSPLAYPRLIRLEKGKEEQDTDARVPVQPPPSIIFSQRSWDDLTIQEKHKLLYLLGQIWQRLSLAQRNRLVVNVVGWNPGEQFGYWSTDENRAKTLKRRAAADLFHGGEFAEILFLFLQSKSGLSNEIVNEEDLAMHYLTLAVRETADDVCFAFVCTYR